MSSRESVNPFGKSEFLVGSKNNFNDRQSKMLGNLMVRKTQGIARKTQFKSQSTKATILKYSKKTDFDHLGLRDPSK